MKKIPTMFIRNHRNMRELLDRPHPDCGWVFAGEGVATRKYDGTCCRVKDGELWRRREVKKGKPIPEGFELADYDNITGKTVGWVKVTDDKADRWHVEAFVNCLFLADGTYELCGPKIQGNPEGWEFHVLKAHSEAVVFRDCPRTMEGLRDWLKDRDIEGVVFHHPDGRMAKIKKRDLGLGR